MSKAKCEKCHKVKPISEMIAEPCCGAPDCVYTIYVVCVDCEIESSMIQEMVDSERF